MMNHLLGRYIAYAFNKPKEYPKKPFMHKQEVKKQMTGEEMDRAIQRNNRILGGTTICHNK